MATIYRKIYPVPMPPGAEFIIRGGRRIARWTDGNGNVKTALLTENGKKILHEAGPWYARYIDAGGIERRVSTGCRDEQAARKVLSDILARAEKVRSGILSPDEDKASLHVDVPFKQHVEDYLEHLKGKRIRGRRVSKAYRLNTRGRLTRLAKECGFRRLSDVGALAVERWLLKAEEADMSASTRNEYLGSLHAMCNWAVRENRILSNPMAAVQKADRAMDVRRKRRALTEDEVARLLAATRIRPVAELGRQGVPLPPDKRKGRHSWTYELLTAENFDACYARGMKRIQAKPATLRRLERLGRERALFYLFAVMTGLRRKELASLTVGHLHLDAVPGPFVELLARDAKNAKGACMPLRADLVREIREYLAERDGSVKAGAPASDTGADGSAAAFDAPLFPHAPVIRVFDADLVAAGIPKADPRGRTADIHALRHTFGTHLSKAGVTPRIAQAAMRHSRIDLTMNLYTDPALLDVAGAVEALPDFRGPSAQRTTRARTTAG